MPSPHTCQGWLPQYCTLYHPGRRYSRRRYPTSDTKYSWSRIREVVIPLHYPILTDLSTLLVEVELCRIPAVSTSLNTQNQSLLWCGEACSIRERKYMGEDFFFFNSVSSLIMLWQGNLVLIMEVNEGVIEESWILMQSVYLPPLALSTMKLPGMKAWVLQEGSLTLICTWCLPWLLSLTECILSCQCVGGTDQRVA